MQSHRDYIELPIGPELESDGYISKASQKELQYCNILCEMPFMSL